jgi:hypothetical protein
MTTITIMPGIRQINPAINLQPSSNKPCKNESSAKAQATEQDALIKSALILVEWIDDNLDCDRVHFWQGDRLLISLDQVVTALLAGELEVVWTFHLSGSFEEVESRTRELRYQFPIAEEREEAKGERWQRVLRTGRVRY